MLTPGAFCSAIVVQGNYLCDEVTGQDQGAESRSVGTNALVSAVRCGVDRRQLCDGSRARLQRQTLDDNNVVEVPF